MGDSLRASSSSVDRVLADVNRLMHEYTELEKEIQNHQVTLTNGSMPATTTADEIVTMPYKTLHSIVSERNFLITNYIVVKEALGKDSKKDKPAKQQQKSLINSASTPTNSPNYGLFTGTTPEAVILKFAPSPRKSLSVSAKAAARQHYKEFVRPDLMSDLPTMI